MPSGKVEFWLPARGEGAIRTEDGQRWQFHKVDLVDVRLDEVRKGLEVEFESGHADRAARVRAAGQAVDPFLPENHPALQEPSASREVRKLLANTPRIHPGLRLDRFLVPVIGQKAQYDRLGLVLQDYAAHSSAADLPRLLARRCASLKALQAQVWDRATATTLTLHLARAAVLENAGICLHPIHGFPYLPGSGLKGLARAFAETVWVPSQLDPARAWAAVERVFGWAPSSDDKKVWKPDGVAPHPTAESAACGSIVFHDAWPATWPALLVDIVNNHHAPYYQGDEPPGDWHDPVPVYFLGVRTGASFEFALTRRRDDVSPESLALAREWLDAGLTHFGMGAKTAAGYGYFSCARTSLSQDREVPRVWTGALGIPIRCECKTSLELVTPAFLAGADQAADDCDLRSASLRGALRWWWRSLHAGYLDTDELRTLEGFVWGDTKRQGLIQTVVLPNRSPDVRKFSYKEGFLPKPDFRDAHRLSERPDQKTTQGLFYLAYGMDEIVKDKKTGERVRKTRFYAEPGASWEIRMISRPMRERNCWSCEAILDQARAALWLLCNFGGIGSKSRRGFGSVQLDAPLAFSLDVALGLNGMLRLASVFRETAGLPNKFNIDTLESFALGGAIQLEPASRPTPWTDPWRVLDDLGFAYQAIAQQDKHNEEKLTLGLPRKIHGPLDNGPIITKENVPVQDRASWRPPAWLRYENANPKVPSDRLRYASPVHLHVGRLQDGRHTVDAIFFPAPRLPDVPRSIGYLADVRTRLSIAIDSRIALATTTTGSGSWSRSAMPGAKQKRAAGTPAQVTFLGLRTDGKPGYLVEEAGFNGKITQGTPPDPLPDINMQITVYIKDDATPPQYDWNPPSPPKRGRGGEGPRRGSRPGPRR
jgi:CRISPR-associated protein Cmr6